MKTIKTYCGKEILVDDDVYEKWGNLTWFLSKRGYVHATVYLHRQVIKSEEKNIDHVNGNRLDNRRSNLRPATQKENARNRGPAKNNKTGYKGVWKKGNKYRAAIGFEGKQIWLGSYHTAEEAAEAYNRAAVKYFKDFAFLNKL